MFVDIAPRWQAGATDGDGTPRQFDSPKCLLRWSLDDQKQFPRDAWVIEYYTQKRTPVDEVLFVIGSDVTSPMGPETVPVAGRAAAERFRKEHGGQRILSVGDIDAKTLRELEHTTR